MKTFFCMIIGILSTSIGIILLKSAHIASGGTAGLALSASYLFDMSFSQIFFLINIPFYIFAYFQLGLRFTLSTLLSVTMLSTMTSLGKYLPPFTIPMWVGAIVGGIFIGYGLSTLFRNGSSLGGFNIMTIFLQKKFNFNPGKTTFFFDFIVLSTGFYAIGLVPGMFSVLSVAIIGYIISYNKNLSCSSTSTTRTSHTTTSGKAPAPSAA